MAHRGASEEPFEDEEVVQRLREFSLVGHIVGLDTTEGSIPSRKRRIGFVTEDDRVLKSGIVKSRRSPKRAKKE